MSYVVIKMIKGNPYLYQVRSERRGNRVRQVFEKYLGRADKDTKQPLKPKSNSYDPTTEKDWRMFRSLIYARDNGVCWICRQFVPLHEYDLGHLIDRCNGGRDNYDNLAVMHKKCNESKPKHNTMDEHITWLLKTKFMKDKKFAKFGIGESILEG